MLDDVQDDLQKVSAAVSKEDRRLLDEHASFVREMEQELADRAGQGVGHAVPELEPGVKQENDNMPRISKMQIDLMVNSFAADFARVATLQYTNSVGGAQMRWLGVNEGHHELSHEPDTNEKRPGKADPDQPVVLRATSLPGQAAGRNARAGRRRQPAGQHADRLDQRTGQGQHAHAGQHPVRAGRRRAGFPDGPLDQVLQRAPQPACSCRWPTASATGSQTSAIPISAATGR